MLPAESMGFTLFVPVLNEIEGMKVIMPSIPEGLFSQVLVSDGGSTDGSAEWAKSMGYDVHIQRKKGLRYAYTEAFPLIRNEYVVTFSPDGNCKPEDLQTIVDKLKEDYDVVVASRYMEGSRSEDDDIVTAFGNWLFNRVINFVHNANYTDAMTIYRGYRKSLFYELDIDNDESYVTEKLFFTVIGIEPLISVRAAKRKLKVIEIPSIEPKRIYGKRKLQVVRWGGALMTQVLREKYYWR